ncbi:unnamed protein product [Sphagnum jensenii]
MSDAAVEDYNEVDRVDFFNKMLVKFKIGAMCLNERKIRNIRLYDLKLYPGTKIATLQRFSEEMALCLHAKGKLSFHPVLSEGLVRVEVMDDTQPKISLIEELKSATYPNYQLPVFLGSSIDGNDIWTDLALNPHLLIAGTTGSGKSVLLHTILGNLLLLSNAHVYIIDTKALEFSAYAKKYSSISILTTYSEACDILEILLEEMETRYSLMREAGKMQCPYEPIVLMIDEFADLVMQDINDKLYNLLIRITQKSRAANIFCVVATQRPSVDIIRGAIKANLPARIACKVKSKTDSRVILDENGAELLVGNGDAIISNYNHDGVRFQAAFSSSKDLLLSGLKRGDFVGEQDIISLED